MSARIPDYQVVSPPLYRSSTSSVERITFHAALSDGCTTAIRKTFTHTDFHQAFSELEVHKQLSDFPEYFPELYYHRFAEERGLVQLIMEHCERGNLAQFLRKKRSRWDINQLHVVMLQLIKGLQKMHSLGISHGDIKPQNVFISSSRVYKIGDFGHAIKHSYCPERTIVGRASMLDFQNDVYDLGKTFLECFALSTERNLAQKSESELEWIIDEATEEYPPGFQDLVKKMMKIDPSARVTIAEAFEFLGSLPLPSARLSETSTTSLHSQAINSSNIRRLINEQDTMSSGRSSMTGSLHPSPFLSVTAQSSHILRRQLEADSDRQFAISAGKIEVILKQHPNYDERLLRNEVERLLAEHQRLRGTIVVKILTTERICKKCRSGYVPSDTVTLPCEDVLCKDCLNIFLVTIIQLGNQKFSRISCPCCNCPFNPFEPSVKQLLAHDVVKGLDEMVVQETTIKCPKCPIRFEKAHASDCIRVICPQGHEFCSYCFKKPHRWSACKEWTKDQKEAKLLQPYYDQAPR